MMFEKTAQINFWGKEEKHEIKVLLLKTKLNTIEFLIPKALLNSYINNDEFVSVNNVLWEYNEIKIKDLEDAAEYTI